MKFRPFCLKKRRNLQAIGAVFFSFGLILTAFLLMHPVAVTSNPQQPVVFTVQVENTVTAGLHINRIKLLGQCCSNGDTDQYPRGSGDCNPGYHSGYFCVQDSSYYLCHPAGGYCRFGRDIYSNGGACGRHVAGYYLRSGHAGHHDSAGNGTAGSRSKP